MDDKITNRRIREILNSGFERTYALTKTEERMVLVAIDIVKNMSIWEFIKLKLTTK
jgi:hypothetical protein